MRLYVVRHGETDANVNLILCWNYNAQLTTRGLEQANLLGEYFQDKVFFDLIYTSDLDRARITWELVNKYQMKDLQIESSPLLRERNYGIWDWISNEHIVKELGLKVDPLEFKSYYIENEEGYEKDEEIVNRISHFFEEYIFPHRDTDITVLIVCHKWTCNVISWFLKWDVFGSLKDPLKRIGFKNTAFSIYDISKNWIMMVSENNTDHLI